MNYPIAKIIVGLPIEGPFDYLIPQEWQNRVSVGSRVAVSFAHARRMGVVVGFENQSSIARLKAIESVLDNQPILSARFLELARRLSERYGCAMGEAVELMLPQELRKLRSVKVLAGPETPICSSQGNNEKTLLYFSSSEIIWPELNRRLKKVLDSGKQAIILVADSAHIDYVVGRLKDVLPPSMIIHDSARTHKNELDHWIALKERKVQVIIGLRTAVFAPMDCLGLIIMLDEDNPSFKEEQSPFYQTREIVLLRGDIDGCDVLFTGVSPSVELINAVSEKKIDCLKLSPQATTPVQLIDMTNFSSKWPMVISYPLRNALENALTNGKTAIVVINRRGHSTYTHCLFCGHVLRCERCASNLVYASTKKRYECRHCETSVEVPKVCPHCRKNYLRSQGFGVERVVQDMKKIFPAKRVERFDRDVAVFPSRFDVLVTTRAVLRMLGKLTVDCVGILDIDAEFNRMDYQSSHKAFSLLKHLALMARSKILIQTFHIDNEVLQHFSAGRDDQFYAQELALRRELKLPPYYHWIEIMARGTDLEMVGAYAQKIHDELLKLCPSDVEVLNVRPDSIAKLRDKFRYIILVRGKAALATLQFVKSVLAQTRKKSGVVVTVRVDP